MKKHVFLIIMLIAWVSTNSALAQDSTKHDPAQSIIGNIGVMAGVQFTGIDAGGSDANVYIKGTYYSHKNRKGFNMFAFANVTGGSVTLGSAYFAIGGGNRFLFKKRTDSFLEFGLGVGLQTGFTPTIRTMIYGVTVIPIKRHRLVGFVSADFGFNILPGSKLQYRYKSFVLYQVTKSSDDTNVLLGLHAEFNAAIGPTLQVWTPGDHIQIWLACGVNPDGTDFHTGRKPSFGGAYGITARF